MSVVCSIICLFLFCINFVWIWVGDGGGWWCNFHQMTYVNHQLKSILYKHLQYAYPDFFHISWSQCMLNDYAKENYHVRFEPS